MNIFILSTNPEIAAKMECDQHVVKMPLESAQMLCAPFPKNRAPYKRTHYNHPCTIWARTSKENYEWLLCHAFALCKEYTFRYGKLHKSEEVLWWCLFNYKKIKFPKKGLTKFVLAMDDKFKKRTPVSSYRNFYIQEKSKFARWKKRRLPPKWYLKGVK